MSEHAPVATGRPTRSSRLPRLLLVMAVAGAAAATALASSVPAQAVTTRYVRSVPVCARASGQRATCDAMKLVPSKHGQPGAVAAAVPATAASLTGPAGGYSPAALAGAYGAKSGAATSITVGIVDAYDDPNVRADLGVFDKQYGLKPETATSLKVVNQSGGVTLPTADDGWAAEISLDVDAVRGMCHTCKIVLVEAATNSYANFAVAENQAVTQGATVVTNSWGGAESSAASTALGSAFDHPGVVITASTGDNGFYSWTGYNSGGSSSDAPELPASLPTVVAVGGTTLNLDNTGARASESVWDNDGPLDYAGRNNSGLGASGGGCSTLFDAPAWQSAVTGYAKTGCGAARMAGDIAALADPYTGYDIYDTYGTSGWQTFGGTSLASPLVAAMWALAGGSGGVDYPAKTLYANLAAGHRTYDVRVGGNGACGGSSTKACAGSFNGSPNLLGRGRIDCSWSAAPSATVLTANGQCNAKVGYDGPSGVGTPVGPATFTP